ncbi:MAG: hypothetical protein KC466_07900, partial [Myxococcales bacterium]|nr:hypothetical protein [Myxococcales bacterium]
MNRSDFVSSDLARSQHPGPALGAADRFARGLVTRLLDRLDWGRAELVDADGARAFGPGGEDAPHARVLLRAPRAYRRIAFGGSIGAAEAYMDGDWDASDLPGLFRMFARAASVFDAMDRGAGRFGERIARAYHVLRRNTREGSRRNIAAHYALG